MRFTNQFDSSKEINFLKILKWRLLNPKNKKREPSNLHIKDDFESLNSKDDFLCWLGHATCLVQLNGKRFLLDPVFGDIPFYKREMEFPYNFEDLGKIDYLLITHTHYDHFDAPSIKKILKQKPCVIAPLGMSRYIEKLDKEAHVVELDWYKHYVINVKLSVHLTPAKHWGRRGLFDTNKALWGGFVISSDKKTIFFAGDSAYDSHFKDIAQRYSIDYAFLPIGAYKPEFIMKTNHLNPSEAFEAFLDLKAKKMMPMHYGTFKLTDEPINEPKEWILEIKKKNSDKICIYDIGEVQKI
jgi:L-ascorbate metabolism protein UlaG (beta-lactamase superfamily)